MISIISLMDVNLSKLWEIVEDREAWWAAVHVLLNCGVGEDSRESLGLCKEIQPVHPKGDQS